MGLGEDQKKPAEGAITKKQPEILGHWTKSYEDYVSKIFTPSTDSKKVARALNEYADDAIDEELPKSLLSKMYAQEETPLDRLYSTYKTYGYTSRGDAKYPVYEPKSSSEYYSIANRKPQISDSPSLEYKAARTKGSPNYWTEPPAYDEQTYRLYKDSNRFTRPAKTRNLVVDYRNFTDPLLIPVSPHLYNREMGVHTADSRYVGSNFAFVTTRPPDYWFERVDKLLAEDKKQRSLY